ncbi:uncharacterized protein DUF4279 [Flavobacterium croceum DSM 17960]|uniref:Uncharacterized protein DUF4279 n=1 Tax=Flavobacterium croceum DSM 17960 TaxID=1121886 RepID=A0A2S4N4G0_9FLAO|nr:DUF4279 domain-containing protein [Flavobacterium croceum]POS00575.1 uncharacterized protein DUF4279 [Flavobacterium croceum DSM 17960]
MYNDNYETCAETYVTLRIYSDEQSPNELTEYLGIQPSKTHVKSQKNELQTNKSIEHNGWFLTTDGKVNSKDSRRHIDFLADKLLPINFKIKELISKGAKIDISCYWLSENGQGGPTLSPQQLSKLGSLGLDFWFDIY